MNRINPLHIGILLIVILLFSFVSLGNTKVELQNAKDEYALTEKVATQLVALKDAYGNKKAMKKSLKRILNLSSLRASKIEQKMKKSGVVLSSESMDKNALNSLMGKLLNGTYNITSFKIKKLSEEKVSFDMEIKW